jgi:hypothetical protein
LANYSSVAGSGGWDLGARVVAPTVRNALQVAMTREQMV